MLLTFSKERFVIDIIQGRKTTTIREDPSNRWKPGMKIDYWKGNPRNPSKNPFKFGIGKAKEVLPILIQKTDSAFGVTICLNGFWISDGEVIQIATNDGLTMREFRVWFLPPGVSLFEGNLIKWDPKESDFIGLNEVVGGRRVG